MTILASVHIEVLLAAGYAVFLIVVALALEAAARFAHRRAERFRVSSFTYHSRLMFGSARPGSDSFQPSRTVTVRPPIAATRVL